MDTYLNVFLLIVLILLSGFFSASETALTAFNRVNLEQMDENKNKQKMKFLKSWLKNPNEMLTGILVGNNLVNILASSIATVLAINYMGTSSGFSILLSTGIISLCVLIFGEITPKIIARNNSFRISKAVIGIIYGLSIIIKPIIKILIFTSKLVGRIIGINMEKDSFIITEEDIISYVNVGEAEGIIEEDEKEMIHSIVGIGETIAKEVMTPRTSMLSFEGDKTIDDVWDEILEGGFSRMPVYGDTIDNILGILYVKDILNAVKNGNVGAPIKDFVRPGYFVPETKSLIEILKEFRKLKVHIAMVLDEYGGVVGLVTIEDLIEEIVGEIRDEFDDEEEEFFIKVDENVYEVDGMVDIEYLNKKLNIDLPDSEDYETLAGLVVSELGRIGDVGDEIDIDSVHLEVIEIEKMRVSKVKLTREYKESN